MQRRINQKLSDLIHREQDPRGGSNIGGSRMNRSPSPGKYINDELEYEEDERARSRPRSTSKSAIGQKSSSSSRNRENDRDYGNKIFRAPSSERSQLFRNPNWQSAVSNQSTNEIDMIDPDPIDEDEVDNESDEDLSDEDEKEDDDEEEDVVQSPMKQLRNRSSSNLDVNGRKYSSRGSKKSSRINTNPEPSSCRKNDSSSRRSSKVSSSHSRDREIMPLPIGFPVAVYDVDTFKRYLSRTESEKLDTPNQEELSSARSANIPSPNLGSRKLISKPNYSIILARKIMTLSQAILILGLLAASCSQLRFVVTYSSIHGYSGLNYFLVCSSLFVEIFVVIGFLILSQVDFSESVFEKLHSYLTFALFYVAIATVIISAFGLEGHICELLKPKKLEKEFDTIDQPLPHIPTVNLDPQIQMVQNRMNPQQYRQQEETIQLL